MAGDCEELIQCRDGYGLAGDCEELSQWKDDPCHCTVAMSSKVGIEICSVMSLVYITGVLCSFF